MYGLTNEKSETAYLVESSGGFSMYFMPSGGSSLGSTDDYSVPFVNEHIDSADECMVVYSVADIEQTIKDAAKDAPKGVHKKDAKGWYRFSDKPYFMREDYLMKLIKAAKATKEKYIIMTLEPSSGKEVWRFRIGGSFRVVIQADYENLDYNPNFEYDKAKDIVSTRGYTGGTLEYTPYYIIPAMSGEKAPPKAKNDSDKDAERYQKIVEHFHHNRIDKDYLPLIVTNTNDVTLIASGRAIAAMPRVITIDDDKYETNRGEQQQDYCKHLYHNVILSNSDVDLGETMTKEYLVGVRQGLRDMYVMDKKFPYAEFVRFLIHAMSVFRLKHCRAVHDIQYEGAMYDVYYLDDKLSVLRLAPTVKEDDE